MAHARKISKPVVQEVRSILLELSPDEAKFLSAVLGEIGGSPTRSPRRWSDSIMTALRDIGYPTGRWFPREIKQDSGIFFADDIIRVEDVDA